MEGSKQGIVERDDVLIRLFLGATHQLGGDPEASSRQLAFVEESQTGQAEDEKGGRPVLQQAEGEPAQ